MKAKHIEGDNQHTEGGGRLSWEHGQPSSVQGSPPFSHTPHRQRLTSPYHSHRLTDNSPTDPHPALYSRKLGSHVQIIVNWYSSHDSENI